MESNITGLYIEKSGAFDKRTYYPTDVESNYMEDHRKWVNLSDNPERLFWNRNMQKNPFVTESFYYAEINHPKLGKAIFGAWRNRGYVWQFNDETGLKTSLYWSLGEIYKDMLRDGYIVIKKGHNTITPD